MKLLLLFFLLLVLLLNSCKKDSISKINLPSFYECNKSLNLDSAAITLKLVGKWKWEEESCDGDEKGRLADKNVVVVFNQDGTYSETQDGSLISNGEWSVESLSLNNGYDLKTSQPSPYLYGNILFCDNQVVFSSSPQDGCDDLFTQDN